MTYSTWRYLGDGKVGGVIWGQGRKDLGVSVVLSDGGGHDMHVGAPVYER